MRNVYLPCTKQKESESRHFFAPRQAQGTRIQLTAAAVRPEDQKSPASVTALAEFYYTASASRRTNRGAKIRGRNFATA